MPSCNICPFDCGVDRNKKPGVCGLPNEFLLSHFQPHFWEEPMISGQNGSGTVFFAGCNGRCVFCQNYKISQPKFWKENKNFKKISDVELFDICSNLIEEHKVHNINFVSPTPYSELLIEFLNKYKNKLKVPIVWNSNGYEKKETIMKFRGLIDIYLPDFKYFDDADAVKYSKMPNYFEIASEAIIEMQRQVGFPEVNKEGIMQKGIIVRHLVLPGKVESAKKILFWIKENFGPKAFISLMAQYYPVYKASEFIEINRCLTDLEYGKIVDCFYSLDFEDGLIQDLSAADQVFTPNWKL